MKALSFVLLALLSQSIQAEVLTLGKFASFGSKEDGSSVEIVSSKVTALAETTGASISMGGCNDGKVVTGEAGPYGTSYKAKENQKVLKSAVVSSTQINISNALKGLEDVKASLKSKTPFYCKVSNTIAVELTVKVVKTNRIVPVILALYTSSEGLVVDTISGGQTLDKVITVTEAP